RTGAVRPAGPQAEGDRGEGEGRGAPAAVGAEEGSGSGRQGSGMSDQAAGISDQKPVGIPYPAACCLLPAAYCLLPTAYCLEEDLPEGQPDRAPFGVKVVRLVVERGLGADGGDLGAAVEQVFDAELQARSL